MNKKEIMDQILKNERPITEEVIDHYDIKNIGRKPKNSPLENYILNLLTKENKYRLRGEVFGLLDSYMRRLNDPDDDLRSFPMLDHYFRKHLVTSIIHKDKQHKVTLSEIEHYDVARKIDVIFSLTIFRLVSEYNSERKNEAYKINLYEN